MQCRLASSSAQSMLSRTAFYALIWTMLFGSSVSALTCFDSTENGDMKEVTSDDFTYCVMMPERIEGNKYVESQAFGVDPASDSTSMYDKIFNANTDMYQILSMCVYEKYDFKGLSPRFHFKQPEYMFRCFCNFDRCNSVKNFTGYLDNLRDQSAVSKSNQPALN